MKTFFIYEVVGTKVGATTEPEIRYAVNYIKYGIVPILIETMEGPDTPEYWQIVGDREWELADLNGYARGTHYRIARERRIMMGQSGGASAVITGQWKECINASKIARRKLTIEQAKEIRNLYATGDYTIKKLAEIYDVKITPIRSVLFTDRYV